MKTKKRKLVPSTFDCCRRIAFALPVHQLLHFLSVMFCANPVQPPSGIFCIIQDNQQFLMFQDL